MLWQAITNGNAELAHMLLRENIGAGSIRLPPLIERGMTETLRNIVNNGIVYREGENRHTLRGRPNNGLHTAGHVQEHPHDGIPLQSSQLLQLPTS